MATAVPHDSSRPSGAELRDVSAEPFAAAIREAGLASVVPSDASVDGVSCAGSPAILTDRLRDELGFDGTVVADTDLVPTVAHPSGVPRGTPAP